MFISKQELELIRIKLSVQQKLVETLKADVKVLQKQVKAQANLNKKFEESIAKRYIHEAFANKSEKETQSLIDEWLNGADKGGGNDF